MSCTVTAETNYVHPVDVLAVFLYIDMCALHSVPWMFVTLISINGVPVFQYL